MQDNGIRFAFPAIDAQKTRYALGEVQENLNNLYRSQISEYLLTLHKVLEINRKDLRKCSRKDLKAALKTLHELASLAEASRRYFSEDSIWHITNTIKCLKDETESRKNKGGPDNLQQLKAQIRFATYFILGLLEEELESRQAKVQGSKKPSGRTHESLLE